VGRMLAAVGKEICFSGHPIAPPACVLAGGETTVTLQGHGKGGRNQELALGAAIALDGMSRISLLSAGTDGTDGPTDAAGAFVDGATCHRARGRGLNPADFLSSHDSYHFFAALGDLLITGPTRTNVMDIMCLLIE
jgi:glycerate 2-kinase